MASVTNRLVFDPTDAGSIAASSTIGAYLLAGTDGEQLDSTSGSLHVNITNSDFDIRDLTHVSDSIRLGDGTDLTTVTQVGSDYGLDVNLINSSIAVTATDLDIRDLSASQDNVAISDGTDTLGVNADGSINVVATASDLDIRDLTHASDSIRVGDGTDLVTVTQVGSDYGLDVNVLNDIDIDDDLANTAIENTATAVSTTAVNVVASALSDRKWMALANEGNRPLYFGKTGVTIVNGFPLHMGMQQVWRIGPSITPQVIGAAGSASEDLRVMELS